MATGDQPRAGGPALRPRHAPERSCVACHRKGPKSDFVRVVRTPEGAVAIDPPRSVPGRGAYVCRQLSCWQAAIEKGRLAHSLKGPVTPQVRASLLEQARERYKTQG
ncbi:MAG: YlxR family protein [SAR202 cluster bacterium]|nr:YlxR family protein [SAR202 cluster bacterium]